MGNSGYCSERGGGVHQICFDVKDETNIFTERQSEWSNERVDKNHCMCLGAWSLYKAKNKGTDKELICESIPEMSLSEGYIGNWNTWNGNELPNQIVSGVNSLMEQCYKKGNPSQKEYLKNKYYNLTDSRPEFYGTDIYKNLNKL